jgi:2-dehydro-3-deoxyphosphogluconate aldolase/(4S)-4-hydroxy-2-oxoglutarate aldolase
LAGIAALRRTLEGRCRVGAGTVLSDADARSATDAGAEYLVTPVFDERVLAAAGARSVPVVCGCTTPSEMLAAHRAGAAFIKLFPATRFGPTFVRDLLGPLPMLRIVPTGGVSANNAAEYIRAGAAAVAAGGKLVDLDAIRSGEWSALSERARALVEAVAGARGGRGEQGRQA